MYLLILLRTLGDLGRAVARLNQDIPALGTKSCGDGLCEGVNTLEERCATLDAELELLYTDQYAVLRHSVHLIVHTLCANLCCWRLKLRELFSADERALVAKRCIVMCDE